MHWYGDHDLVDIDEEEKGLVAHWYCKNENCDVHDVNIYYRDYD